MTDELTRARPSRRARGRIALGLALLLGLPPVPLAGQTLVPDQPGGPAQTVSPTQPGAPVQAVPPAQPDAPVQAVPPAQPGAAAQPTNPLPTPTPAQSTGPARPAAPMPAAEEAAPKDLSPWAMFEAAGPVVRGVMIGLAVASLLTWTVWLAKSLEMVFARARLRRAQRAILAAANLREAEHALAHRRGIAAVMVGTVAAEIEASAAAIDPADRGGLVSRVESHLARAEAREARRMTSGTGLLATIGSTAPFVGLFGTVWGIMTSFIGIAESNTTNLAVVAPGIAEALLATALGLVAAIPAVVIYNHFARVMSGYRALLADTSAAIERLVSRDLDHDRLGAPALRQAAE